jgi:hypothetical protein
MKPRPGTRAAKNSCLRAVVLRVCLSGGASCFCAGVHLLVYGALAMRAVPMGPRQLQAFLASAAAAVFLSGAAALYGARWVVPGASARAEDLLPCSVRRKSAMRPRVDSDDEDEGGRDGDDGEAEGAPGSCCSCCSLCLLRLARSLQFGDFADSLTVGYLTVLWHVAMSAPICTLVFERRWSGPEALYVYMGLAGLVGLGLAALSVHTLLACDFLNEERDSWGGPTGAKGAARRGVTADGAVVAPESLRRRKAGGGGGGGGGGGEGAGGGAANRSGGLSPLKVIAWPLVYHGLAALLFLVLHIDRGGKVSFNPFDDPND